MLIDGHSMAFRAFYALPAENFSTTGGQHTNAVYGFLSMLTSLLKEERPTHIAVAFDVGRNTFRTEMFPEYKAQREAAPEEFRGQVELIQEVLNALGIVTMQLDNFEADDIIATLATAAQPLNFETLVVTGDRDSFQLVNDSTTVLYPMRGVSVLHRFTPEAVEEKYGLTPAQYPDFAALRGDPSDNLPNIPGVGEKTATKWIKEYGSLANLLEHAADIKGRAGNNLRERLDQVRLNRRLTEMVKDLDLPYQPNELEFDPVTRVLQCISVIHFGSVSSESAVHIALIFGDLAVTRFHLIQHRQQGIGFIHVLSESVFLLEDQSEPDPHILIAPGVFLSELTGSFKGFRRLP